ncbi:MAG: DUF3772 domain-containing protein [Cypionkella sp.]|nr:DUF3772 domain-containing protein [Cypionkella sp.]
MSARWRGTIGALILWAAGAAMAQVPPVVGQADRSGALVPRQGAANTPMAAVQGDLAADAAAAAAQLDYQAWNKMALRGERAIENTSISDSGLETLRGQIATWREALQSAQNANSARISTLRAQIAALGPAPSNGFSEPEDLAKRRAELTQQMTRLQAPSIAAIEAYERADGIIREIDRILRERQASQLMQLWPAPINPANWPEAVIGLTDTGLRLWDEVASAWADDKRRRAFLTNVPLIVFMVAIGFALIMTARIWVQRLALRLREGSAQGAQRIIALLASLGEMIFPLLGLLLIGLALSLAEMTGELGTSIIEALPDMAMPVIIAAWMAGRIFPRGALAGPLGLGPEARSEARLLTVTLGLVLGIDVARDAAMSAQEYSEGTTSVTSFPGLVIAGLLLLRIGQLIARHLHAQQGRDGEAQNFGRSSLLLVAQAAVAIGIVGPVLGAVGYIAAASALVYPAILSLGLIAILLICQHLVGEIYAMATGRVVSGGQSETGGDSVDGLIPVLANFALSVASLPVFALIWGARVADITEIWTRFGDGFQFGTTRISPSNFFLFALVFAIGYGLTRLLQGALRSTILPRTALDMGARNAMVSGVGYLGIIFAALIAINTAGIDLSGLAIVAGALSVGIGFGLQNIVSNFVSGIILLIERPVSEGDWIEVGTTSGIVKSISVRSTRIQTFDRSDVIVPNTDLVAGRVTNWTRFNLTGRLIVPISVPHGADSRRVEAILRDIAENQPLALMNPAPVVALMGLGGDALNFEMRVILRDVNAQVAVRSEINHQIAQRFAAERIAFFPADAAAQTALTVDTATRAKPPRRKAAPTNHPIPPKASA